jgi:hypothetical protein
MTYLRRILKVIGWIAILILMHITISYALYDVRHPDGPRVQYGEKFWEVITWQ